MVSIPVLKIDEPMIDKALTLGSRIGIAATATITFNPTNDLVYQRAEMLGIEVIGHW
jgi:glutamate racemase